MHSGGILIRRSWLWFELVICGDIIGVGAWLEFPG
jgi:hypothetical protein